MSIQNLLKTAGWKEVEALINKKIDKCEREEVSWLLPSSTYKVNDLANKKAANTLRKFLAEIKLMGIDIRNKGNISYK